MKQQTLAVAQDQDAGFEQYRRPTKRDVFLTTMQEIVPWSQLCAVIEPHYPKAGNGRPPIGLERMLRMYFVQQWFNLADEACEEALLDSSALRRFVGVDLGRERVPDGTTLLKFRRLLEAHNSGLAHSAVVTAANVHDKHALPDLLHGNEQRMYGDSAYASQKDLIKSKAPKAKDFTNQRVRKGGEIDEVKRAKNRLCRAQAVVGI